ncbi:MBL fold metallo-hydrolase [Marinobacterium nitratireducens]|uniref:MBL fold metallo-hydrolase n=1 Tax=Marinobacterium nitratireducens TaxID=518897 RepID=A0A917ZKA3_9GAMM|nr:MBL fold metallo-hydrolase [Marinobacterium nitratireducens]GGO83674.1 MBL fold metallo-hydrolase [Marinobacterium nitratireducens]
MNAIRAAFTEIPAPGAVQPVADGILWLRMPLPFELDHINLYLIDDGDGWVAIDSGLVGEETRGHWRRLVEQALGGRPLKVLLVTHSHPDHLGSAGWLCREYGIPLWITRPEYRAAQALLDSRSADAAEDQQRYYRAVGMNREQTEAVATQVQRMASAYDALPPVGRVLGEGDELQLGGRRWQVRVAKGHSPAHAVLYCPDLGVMLSGDQVLPRISSNVGLYQDRLDSDPLGHWLESLERLLQWPDDTLVLPSHNEPFFGLHRRLHELQADHADKLVQLEDFCREPMSVMELVPLMYPRRLGSMDLLLAAGECLAHLHYLMQRGRLVHESDADGVWRFSLPSG